MAAPAEAATPKDIVYSYGDAPEPGYLMVADVDYTKSGNSYTVKTKCSYFRGSTAGSMQYIGHYTVPGAPADTSYEGLKEYCTQHFNDRIYP